MVDGGKLVFQLVRSAVGFIAAVIACSLFFAWGFWGGYLPTEDPVYVGTVIGTGLVSASFVGATVFFPASLMIVIAELWSLRSFMLHVAAGGAIAFGVWTLGGLSGAAVETGANLGYGLRPGTSIALAAGFIGGLVYWLLAGRTSGCWKTRRPGDPAS